MEKRDRLVHNKANYSQRKESLFSLTNRPGTGPIISTGPNIKLSIASCTVHFSPTVSMSHLPPWGLHCTFFRVVAEACLPAVAFVPRLHGELSALRA